MEHVRWNKETLSFIDTDNVSQNFESIFFLLLQFYFVLEFQWEMLVSFAFISCFLSRSNCKHGAF